MACPSGSLDYWRKFFRSANSDIFEVIEQAVLVAASDWPQEFRNRRDQIVGSFYTSLLPRCYGCNRLEHQAGGGNGGRSDSGAGVTAVEAEEEGDGSVRRDVEKACKAGSSCNEGPEDLNRFVSNYSYDEAEALTEEIEEQSLVVGEVLRIKELLLNHHDESDSELFESLRRLQLMELTVEVLEATEIGRAVNGLRKHNMKEIRHLVRTLIDGWKVLVDEWVSATAAIADHSPDSVNPSTPAEEEEGLPSPPLDEGALFATQTADIQFSGFFDGMDDDGNFRNNAERGNKQENVRRPPINRGPVRKLQSLQQPLVPQEKVQTKRQELHHSIIPEEKEQMKRQQPRSSTTIEENRQMKKHEIIAKEAKQQEPTMGQARFHGLVNKQNKPVISGSGPGRPLKVVSEQKSDSELKLKQPQNITAVQRKQPMVQEDKSKNSEEASIRAKLESAKRKLHEGYQQAENAKKQRTIQVMELHDIPKQAHNNRHPVMKSRNNLRNWVNGRH